MFRSIEDITHPCLGRIARGQMDRVISGHVQFQGSESPDGIFSPHKLDTTRNFYPNSKDPFAPSLSDQGLCCPETYDAAFESCKSQETPRDIGEGSTGRLSTPPPCESSGARRTSGRSCSSVMSLRPRRRRCRIVKMGWKASSKGASSA